MGKIKYGLPTLLAIGFWMDATSATVLEATCLGAKLYRDYRGETGKR